MTELLPVLYEDNHLIAINKKAGQIVQVDKTGDISLEMMVAEYIATRYHKPGKAFIGVIHRLDRPVSGVVLFARNSKALSRMNEAFQEKSIRKIYRAVVFGCPSPQKQTLKNYIVRNPEKNKSFVVAEGVEGSKWAELDYEVIASIEKYSLLEIHLKTGRHHQIRCQLAHIGFPVKGDLKYGYPRSNPDGSISLHASSVEFDHPVTHQHIRIEAPAPDEKIWKLLINQIPEK